MSHLREDFGPGDDLFDRLAAANPYPGAMTDREALEQIAVIVRSADIAATARSKIGDIINKVLGPPGGTPFSRP